jgi:DNA-binding MarR family transcriptional regulator
MARNAKIKPVHYTDAQENERKLEAKGFIEREPLFVKRNVKVTKKGLDALKKLNQKNEQKFS